MTDTVVGNVTDVRSLNTYGEIGTYEARHSGASIFKVVYGRDNAGRITSRTETIGGATHVYAYGYDPAGRLQTVNKDGVLTAHYTFDDNGNRTGETVSGKTGTYDDQDRMLTYGGTGYTYTANGELQIKTPVGPSRTYTYDVMGSLRSTTLPNGSVVEYLVDPLGRRIGKKVDGTLTKAWLYRNALQPVAELDGAGNVVSRFVYGLHANVPEYMIKGGNTYRFVHDHLGSVRLVVDVSTGTIAQRIDHDEFGKVLNDTSPGFQPFGFAGGLYDPDTGLVRFGARDYDAETGRWTEKDPLRFGGGDANLYGYVVGDPINRFDPYGEDGTVIDFPWWMYPALPALAPIVVPVAVVALFGATFSGDVALEDTDWYARKRDIKEIDDIAKRTGLDKAQRRRLHDEITRQRMPRDEIERIAREIKGEEKPDVCEEP